MGLSGPRTRRVGDLVREEVASMLLRGEIKDPRIGFVTITGVKMTGDLKSARIYFSVIGTPDKTAESTKGLNSASGYIRRALAKRLKLKYIPTVVFEFDESIEYADHIEQVMREVRKEDADNDPAESEDSNNTAEGL